MGKLGFEKREDSSLKETSRLFWAITSQLQRTKNIVISTNNPQKRKFFHCDLGGTHEACSCVQR